MKKLITKYLSLIGILLLGDIVMMTSCQALSCKVQIHSPLSTYTKGDEFSATVSISSLQAGKGVVALGAVLDYDDEVLELKSAVGENKWSIQIGEKKAKIVGFSEKKVIKDEEIMKLTFLIKNGTTAENTNITIKDFELSDGSEEITAETAVLSLSIQNKKETPPKGEDNTGNGNSGGSSTTTKPITPPNNEKPDDKNDNPTTIEKPDDDKTDEEESDSNKEEDSSDDDEKEPDESKEEVEDSTKPSEDEKNVDQNKSHKWIIFILIGVIIIIILAILNQIIRRKK